MNLCWRVLLKDARFLLAMFVQGLVQGETRLIHFKKDLTAAIRVEATSKVEKKVRFLLSAMVISLLLLMFCKRS